MTILRILTILITCTTFEACNLEDGIDGFTSLINVINKNPGAKCPSGGYKIETGIDMDRDGVLTSDEVQDSIFICNGENGLSSLVSTTVETPGSMCPVGGTKLEIGIDLDNNGTLDPSEVQETHYICDGPFQSVIRLTIRANCCGNINIKSNSSEWRKLFSDLIMFNIRDYPDIDSAFFIASS